MNLRTNVLSRLCVLLVSAVGPACSGLSHHEVSVPDYPIAGGVSAPLAGVVGDRLWVAGGCNFPHQPAADGGSKEFYADQYVLDLTETPSSWRSVGRLPQPVAYGVSVQVPQGMVCVGGQRAGASLAEAFLLQVDAATQDLVRTALPSLPVTIDNGAGAYVAGKVIVTGGNQSDGGRSLYALDLAQPVAWVRLTEYPGALRIQPVLLADASSVYLMGGFAPARQQEGRLSGDVWKYHLPSGQWSVETQVPLDADALPIAVAGASGVCYRDCLILAGGVNASVFQAAIEGRAPEDYLRRPREWYRFSKTVAVYRLQSRQWRCYEVEGMDKAGGVLVRHGDCLYMVCGEIKPGIRTQEVVACPLDRLGL